MEELLKVAAEHHNSTHNATLQEESEQFGGAFVNSAFTGIIGGTPGAQLQSKWLERVRAAIQDDTS